MARRENLIPYLDDLTIDIDESIPAPTRELDSSIKDQQGRAIGVKCIYFESEGRWWSVTVHRMTTDVNSLPTKPLGPAKIPLGGGLTAYQYDRAPLDLNARWEPLGLPQCLKAQYHATEEELYDLNADLRACYIGYPVISDDSSDDEEDTCNICGNCLSETAPVFQI